MKKLISAVYHINGVNNNIISDKSNIQCLIILYTAYYDAIINNILDDKNQIPGTLYGGTNDTYVGMISAIKNNMDKIDKDDILIILDIKKDKFDDIYKSL